MGRIPATILLVGASVLPLFLIDHRPSGAAVPSRDRVSHPPAIEAAALTGAPDIMLPDQEAAPKAGPPPPVIETLTVKSGDTLMVLLTRAGISRTDAHNAITALAKYVSPKRIRPGQELKLVFNWSGDDEEEKPEFVTLLVPQDAVNEVKVSRLGNGEFQAEKLESPIVKKLFRAEGEIEDSLYLAAEKVGIAPPILMELIRIYSWDVDFQRGIRKGDRFELLYERFFTEKGELAAEGNILYANLKLRGTDNRLTRFKAQDGTVDYFDDDGRSAKKSLMRTPINGARLSSGYGKRRHPILGYNKMHRGLDFAAPQGTPIFAAGSGTVVYRARNGAYGNYIRIRHNAEFSTAYGHLFKFASNVPQGSRVRQGQVIGFVGTTGRSTGPHLHYEILRRGRQINPLRLKLPSGRKLSGEDLTAFLQSRDGVIAAFEEMKPISRIARAGDSRKN